MKAYFYCRVAHDDSFSLERQAEELRRYAEQAGYTIVGAAAEHGSGMTLDRPALRITRRGDEYDPLTRGSEISLKLVHAIIKDGKFLYASGENRSTIAL